MLYGVMMRFIVVLLVGVVGFEPTLRSAMLRPLSSLSTAYSACATRCLAISVILAARTLNDTPKVEQPQMFHRRMLRTLSSLLVTHHV